MRCPKCNQKVEEENLELALVRELQDVQTKLTSIISELPTSDFSAELYDINNDLSGAIKEKQIEIIEGQ